MDAAPLSAAHAHARNAAALGQGPNLKGAQEEHELAAQDFAKAKATVGDSEALRILDLLEHHHQKLAEIIKSQSAPAKVASPKDGENTTSDTTATVSTNDKDPHVPKLISRTSTSPVRTRRLHRETSSSIADNLARQRRGLPAAAELSNLQAGGRILSHIERPGYGGNRQRSPESLRNTAPSAASLAAPAEVAPKDIKATDDSFSKFYTTFEGLFSKLSGPLAFAGLPLTTEEDKPAPTPISTSKERDKPSTRATSSDDPDLTRIYSAAALKAIREDVGPSFGPQESFYLVPPTGGTVSYAGMVSGGARGGSSSHHIPDTIAEDDDEFVDARESIGPPSPRGVRKGVSPTASRDGGRQRQKGATVMAGGKTSEELELEIGVLKQLLDKQARRLEMWEMSSQHQSMALQQSMRAVRQRPDLPSLPSDPSSLKDTQSDKDATKIRELEEMLQEMKKEREEVERKVGRVERENERLVTTVGRYRGKWEQLKAGARKREDDKRKKATGEGSVKDGET